MMTLGWCNSKCQGSPYFGLQAGTNCYCLSSTANSNAISASGNCTITCRGHSGQTCGGATQLSVLATVTLGGGSVCAACPTLKTSFGEKISAVCDGGFYPPYAAAGFWAHAAAPMEFRYCYEGRCTGGQAYGNTMAYAVELSSCDKEDRSQGVMCAECANGDWKFGYTCYECPHAAVLWLVAFLALCVLYPAIFWCNHIMPTFHTGLVYVQMIATIGHFSMPWPWGVKAFTSLLDFATFNPDLWFLGCSTQSYVDKFLILQSLPLFYAALFPPTFSECALLSCRRASPVGLYVH